MDRILAGESPLEMHGRDDSRDFLDWRDAIDAYVSILSSDAPTGTIWNLCSGTPTPVSENIREILDLLGMETPFRFKNTVRETIVGNPSRLMRETGWKPTRRLRMTLESILAQSSLKPRLI